MFSKNLNLKLFFKPYRDALKGPSLYNCDITHCFRAMEYVQKINLFNIKKFDHLKYEFYSDISNGFMNWIVKDKILAFSTPYDQRFLLKNVF